MMIKILLILLSATILAGVIIFWPYELRIKGETENLKTDRPEFPITVYSEDKGEISVRAVLIIPEDHYNQSDLVRVMKWYSKENSKYYFISVHLYTNPKNARSYWPMPRSLCQQDASYVKVSRTVREADEWFIYRRFLPIPVCSNRVVLSGNYHGPRG